MGPSIKGFCRCFYLSLLAWAVSLLPVGSAAWADPVDWPTLAFSPVCTNTFSQPLIIAHAGDGSGRMFIGEQAGRIQILQGTNRLAQPFLDLTNRILSVGTEQGLLGLAFPPGFSTKQYFYLDYTRPPDGAVVISRFNVSSTNANVADTNSEQVILVVLKPYNNHNAGQLAFGPDGYLYIGVGDGGSEGDPQNYGQNTGTLLGKLLRIDVESGISPYSVPTNNPFIGNTNYAPEIWATGLRNPWRFSFDRQSGGLYIGDVGQSAFEEIDFQPAGSLGGQNYGWRITEGPTNYIVPAGFTNFSALTAPVAWYSHAMLPSDFSAAVIGGYVYRGPDSSRLNGLYFYGDFVAGWIWGLKQSGTNWQNLPLLSPSFASYAISTFGEDDAGQIYLADYSGGKIYQLQDTRQVWTPAFLATNGVINLNSVGVSCLTTGAVIHYTSNGLDPTESDPAVAAGGFIPATAGFIYKIRAYRADLAPSSVVSAAFTLQVGTPAFSPSAGTITNNTPVSLTSVTPGAVIYYTTNGTTPATNSRVYTKPLILSGGTTLEALGVATNYANSLVAIGSYSAVQTATPVISPPGGPITNNTRVTITIATPNAVIHYNTSGKVPTTASPVYSGPLTLSGGVTLHAIGFSKDYSNSVMASAVFTAAQVASPVFNPPTGPITNLTPVAISCATPGSIIYYTTNGSVPSTKSPVYSRPLILKGGTTLTAFATAKGYSNSLPDSVLFQLIQTATPTLNPASGPISNGTPVTISCATPGATIYYTLDDDAPTTNSFLYAGPTPINGTLTLNAFAVAPGHQDSAIQSTFFTLSDYRYPMVVTTIAGNGQAGASNAVGASASFRSPRGICLDAAGNLYVADTGNNLIRKITPAGLVTTFASNGLSTPIGICLDPAGNLYVTDSGDYRILKIDSSGNVSVFAGNGINGYQDGAPGVAEFLNLGFLTTDAHTNLYVGDWARVRTVASDGTVGTLAGDGVNNSTGLGVNIGLSIDRFSNVYAVSTAGRIFSISPSGLLDLFAGNFAGYNDGPRLQAGFAQTSRARDTAVDAAGHIYVCDGSLIRRIDTNGWVSTLAGFTSSGFINGSSHSARFGEATGLCVDTHGNLYVVDTLNNAIRKISPDTAGIGIADDWQIAHFGHVGIDPNADPDHDGMSNYAEFWSGTDPLDPNSFLAIQSLVVQAGGHAQIRWQTVSGKIYTVQYSDDLITWTALGNPVVGDGSLFSATDPTTTQQAPHRNYRVYLVF